MWNRRSVVAAGIAAAAVPASARVARDRPLEIPIVLDGDGIWVAASIDGSEPLLFLIDTGGAVQTIRPDIARQYRLRSLGQKLMRGIGPNTVHGEFVVAQQLRFAGGLVQTNRSFITYPLEAWHLGPKVAGIMAAGLFTARDSELDLDAGVWRLWPDGRPDHDGLQRLDARIVDAGRVESSPRLIATVLLDGRPFRMLLDTGAPGLLLYPRATRQSGYWTETQPFAPAVTAGYGGRFGPTSRVVRAARFQLGPLALERPLLTMMPPAVAQEGDDHDGLVGIGVLQMLTLATDVRARALWARRNGRAPPPDRYRRSGVWLKRAGTGARVAAVGTGSPAAAAGVRTGDTVVEPASFEAAIRATTQPEVAIAVAGASGPAPRRWTNRDYL